MIPPIVPLLAADATVTALLGSAPIRVYPFGEAPELQTYPYATWTVFSGNPQNQLGDVPDMDVIGTQVDIWGETASSALDVAAAIRDAIEPHAHMVGFGSTTREAETGHYRVRLEFDFFTER